MNPSPGREVTMKLLREFPEAATKTLARKAYAEFPELWSSLETCRDMFRRYRGAKGERERKETAVKEFFRKPQPPGDPFDKLPEPLQTVEQWKPVQISGPLKVAVLSDVHIPYHDKAALRIALSYCRDRGADFLLLNGDIADFFSISRWETDPRNRNFKSEVEQMRQFLEIVRKAFPKSRIVYRLGNHEERFIRYMQLKAPELLDVPDFQFASLLRLGDFGIELVQDSSPVRLGALHTLHGHEFRFSIQNPVNPARGMFLRAKVNAICGHFHQSSHHPGKRLDDYVVSCWSTGCLCDLHPQFRPYNEWAHGFAFVEVEKDGAFQVSNLRIINGKAWH